MGTGQKQVYPPVSFFHQEKQVLVLSPVRYLSPLICSSFGRMAVALPKSTNTFPPSILWTIPLIISPRRF